MKVFAMPVTGRSIMPVKLTFCETCGQPTIKKYFCEICNKEIGEKEPNKPGVLFVESAPIGHGSALFENWLCKECDLEKYKERMNRHGGMLRIYFDLKKSYGKEHK